MGSSPNVFITQWTHNCGTHKTDTLYIVCQILKYKLYFHHLFRNGILLNHISLLVRLNKGRNIGIFFVKESNSSILLQFTTKHPALLLSCSTQRRLVTLFNALANLYGCIRTFTLEHVYIQIQNTIFLFFSKKHQTLEANKCGY